MTGAEVLRGTLSRIDGRGYKAYKDLRGRYELESATLYIDHVQGDPFAAPSKVRLRVPQSVAKFPAALFENGTRLMALEDFIAREARRAIPRGGRRGTGKSGLITIDAGAQEVLERTAVVVTPEFVEARMEVGLPAAGRTILGGEAERLLLKELPSIARRSLYWSSLDERRCASFVDTVENQEHLRGLLADRGLVAFVADGSILPRESGASDRPMKDAVAFQSPASLRVHLPLLHPVGSEATLSGMGVPRGVTLVVGGGYHGKSTLLKAVERGVYPHIPGDGREYVVTRADAVKIRAEDGRHVSRVDISPFIRNLPMGRSTEAFSTEDASGSTSQAANIMEALEVGAEVLLLDEDTSATNFMVRDARMQTLVASGEEPILPFLDRVRELSDRLFVSTVLVMGGSGDYFDVADTVIRMKSYVPEDVTSEAKRIAAERPTGRSIESDAPISKAARRTPVPSSIDASRGRREVKIDVGGVDRLAFGTETIDLRGVEQLVDPSQTRAIGYAMYLATKRFASEDAPLSEILDRLEDAFEAEGMDLLAPFGNRGEHPGNFARPRRFEVAASLNRLRSVRMQTVEKES